MAGGIVSLLEEKSKPVATGITAGTHSQGPIPEALRGSPAAFGRENMFRFIRVAILCVLTFSTVQVSAQWQCAEPVEPHL